MKILCTADIHIGRRAALPKRFTSTRYATAAIWEAMVQYALDEGVDLVLLAGDIVDRDNRFYEAYGPLDDGLKKLTGRGIQVCAVAGNHDVKVIDKLADALDPERFTLLGRRGRWERKTIQAGEDRLHVDGWSFPEKTVRQNPLLDYAGQAGDDDAPVLIMLHCDLGQPDSPYAPVTRSDLARHRPDLWLFGHVHKPVLKDLPNGVPYLYPGSPMAMDFGETGMHGPWLLETSGSTLSTPRQIPLSPVRYETVTIPMAETCRTEDDFHVTFLQTLKTALSRTVDDAGEIKYLGVRATLTGQTVLHTRLLHITQAIEEELDMHLGETTAFMDRIICQTTPPVDLAELAKGNSAPSLLARLIQELDAGHAPLSSGTEKLLTAVNRRLASVYQAGAYQPLQPIDPAPPGAAAMARHCAMALLAELIGGEGSAP